MAIPSIVLPQALFVKPVKVLGDPQYAGTASNPFTFTNNGPNWTDGREFSFPIGIAIDNSVSPPNIYIADAGNNRVLGFRYTTQLTAGAKADIVLGQVDFFTNLPQGTNGRSTGMNQPSGLACDPQGNLYVADTGNNRVLRYPKPLSQPSGLVFPDLVIGQTTLSGKTANAGGLTATSLALSLSGVSHTGLAIDGTGNLWVSDTANNRILRYSSTALSAGRNGPAADLVLGQNDFLTRNQATVRNSKSGLTQPLGLSFDTAGRLLVVDSLSRVVVYPSGVANNGLAARVAGIDPNIVTTGVGSDKFLNTPFGIAGTTAGVVVADSQNHRVMIFPPVEQWTDDNPAATSQVGQPNFTEIKVNRGQGDASAISFNFPAQIAFSGSELFVADAQNNRVLVFNAGPSGVTSSASRVIGQLDFPFSGVNLLEGREFQLQASISATTVLGSAVLDQSVSPPRLWVADTLNNRVLGFKDFGKVKNGDTADIVIGQPDLFRSLVNYPSNDGTTPNSRGLRFPTSLAVDAAGNLYVADTGNSRILRFASPFNSEVKALQAADLVLGQLNFSSVVIDPTERTMNAPVGIALTTEALKGTGGYLIATDAVHNRVLFFPAPFTSGMAATKLLGSLNFSTTTGASADPPRLSAPHGVAVDAQDRVIIVDTGNRRVQVFNSAANINNYDTPPISIASGFSLPLGVTTGSTGFWVNDASASVLVHYPTVDLLPIRNNAPDGTLRVLQPLSVFEDSFKNVLVADGIQRVVYYAPQVTLVSAANYMNRPLTAGSVAAIFPTVTTNTIAGGTDTAPSQPLATTLSDTQVLVNGVAAPLFYVSPGQINIQLSNSLPSGGTADIQVVNVSKGQIYGGAELQLASAAPGLFSANGSGGGQVVAQNAADFSLNSPTNAVTRGQTLILYGTGVGPVPNPPADGVGATSATSAPTLPLILIGSSTTPVPSVNISYSGLAPTLVGVWQLNVVIPENAQTGTSVPIRVFQNSIPSVDSTSPGGSATISIK